MKKKLLALAVAAALPMVSQAATADVTIYGKVHSSIDYVDPAAKGTDTTYDVNSRNTRIGFKGSEDLGDGLKVIWKIETTVSADKGGFGKGRNTYIGLAGGWGTFLYGRHDTPLKIATTKLDIFHDQMADNRATAGFIDIRADDAIAYVSPSFSGLTLVGAVIPDGSYDGTGDFGGAYSVSAIYSNGGLYAMGAWEQLDDLLNGADASQWRIGAGFDMGNFHIGAIYGEQDAVLNSLFSNTKVASDTSNLTINGSFKFGNNKLKAMWGQMDPDSSAYDKNNSWALGLDHSFSKRTKVYVQYVDSENGLKFVTGPGKTSDASGLSFGMVHKF